MRDSLSKLWENVAYQLRNMTPQQRRRMRLIVAFTLTAFGLGGLVDGLHWSAPEITPENLRFGWKEAKAKIEAPIIAARQPAFAITDNEGNIVSGAGKNAELWKFTRLANGGAHIPTWRQESGDCVSMGWSNAVAYRMGVQIAQEQRNELLKIPFPPYMYGISRVQIGKRQLGRGAGSVGAWAAQGSQAYGVYPIDQATKDGFVYSGRLADQWGQQGPPQKAIDYADDFRIRTVSQVRSWEDVRDALVHGYPVTIASNVGFDGGSFDEDGKRWLRPRGRWAHQMCVIGVEDRPGRKKGASILNSWGADAHPKPLNDEPPGSFWADAETIQRIVAQGDSWAFSDFDGFPAPDDPSQIDWNIFREQIQSEANDPAEVAAIEAVEQPEQQIIKETRKMWAFPIGLALCGLGAVIAITAFKWRRGAGIAAALILSLSLVGIGATAEAGPKARARRQAAWNQYQPTTQVPAVIPQVVSKPATVPSVSQAEINAVFGNPLPQSPVHVARDVVPVAFVSDVFRNPLPKDSTPLIASDFDLFKNPMLDGPHKEKLVVWSAKWCEPCKTAKADIEKGEFAEFDIQLRDYDTEPHPSNVVWLPAFQWDNNGIQFVFPHNNTTEHDAAYSPSKVKNVIDQSKYSRQ